MDSLDLGIPGAFFYSTRLENGILPVAGAWEDQPYIYCEVMDLLSALTSDKIRKDRLAQEQERKALEKGNRHGLKNSAGR